MNKIKRLLLPFVALSLISGGAAAAGFASRIYHYDGGYHEYEPQLHKVHRSDHWRHRHYRSKHYTHDHYRHYRGHRYYGHRYDRRYNRHGAYLSFNYFRHYDSPRHYRWKHYNHRYKHRHNDYCRH